MSVVTHAARTQTIAFLSSGAKEADEALKRLVALYGNSPLDEADVIVALGGDGLMLQTLHNTMKAPKPIYGMNRGSVGFLMNDYSEHGLRERLAAALPSIIHPLVMRARDVHGAETTARAINEVSLLRQTYQAAKLASRSTRRRSSTSSSPMGFWLRRPPARPPIIFPPTDRSCRSACR